MQITTYLTQKNGSERLEQVNLIQDVKVDTRAEIIIDDQETYQSILGFGGAFTEAACYTLNQLSEANQEEILKAYFDPEQGLSYTLGRVSIHSCDFSLENYTYIEEGDTALKTFDLSREDQWVIPTIKKAEKISGQPLKILASPWSPPAFMKTTNEMNHGGKLLPEYQQSWADYYIKFIESYDQRGIDIWGLTVQNEPAAKQTWDSCLYTAAEERDFVKNYLGPTVKESGYPETNIIIWDHNRDIVVERATTVLEDPEAAQYIWGTGIHWYVSEAFENVGEVHKRFPDKHLLFTEGTQEGGVHLGSWITGERYARNMIGDLNHWVRGYIDWNLVLNEEGGPNHVGNYCDAPIIADTKNDIIHYNSSYYYIGHFSRFIQPEAQRIKVQMDPNELKVTAFKNPNGQLVIIVLNEAEQAIDFKLAWTNETVVMHSPKRSIQTILVD